MRYYCALRLGRGRIGGQPRSRRRPGRDSTTLPCWPASSARPPRSTRPPRLAWLKTVRDGVRSAGASAGRCGATTTSWGSPSSRRRRSAPEAGSGGAVGARPVRQRMAMMTKPRSRRLDRSARARPPHDGRHVRPSGKRCATARSGGRCPRRCAGTCGSRCRASPSPAEAVYQDFRALVQPYATGNLHPRFMGWVHGGGNPVGMLAELLAAGLNANLRRARPCADRGRASGDRLGGGDAGISRRCVRRAGHRHLDRQPDRRAGGAHRRAGPGGAARRRRRQPVWSPTPRPPRMAACRGRWTWPDLAATRCA